MASVTLLTNIETFEYPYQSNYKLYIWPDETKKSWQLPANNKITNIQYTITYDGRIGGTASAVGLWFEGNIDSLVKYGHDDGFDDIAGTGVLKMDISKVNPKNLFGEKSDLRITIRPVNPDVNGAKTIARKLISQIILTIEYEPQADPSRATVNTVNLGTTQLINIQTYVGGKQQDVSGLMHDVTLTYGGGANTVQKTWTKTTSYSLSFTPTTNEISKLCNYNPTGTDLVGTLTITTYTSADATESEQAGTWTANPHMTITDAVAGPRALDRALGHTYKNGVPNSIYNSKKPYQNWSVFSVEPNIEWVNTQPGQITVTCTDGQITETGNDIWTATPTVSGTYVITATATDARGFTASYTWTTTLEPCAGPIFTRIDVHRCISTSNTDENDEGEYCYVYVAFTTNEIPGNETGDAPQINVSILDMSDEPVAEKTVKAESVKETVLTTVLGGNLAKDMNYRVNIELSDAINLKTTTTTTLGQAFYTVHRMAGGKGIAFGTISTTEGVTVNPDWPFYTHGQEIEHLILNAAHPIGSALETIDSGFNPSTLWPWTVWGRIATQTLDGKTVYFWVRAR